MESVPMLRTITRRPFMEGTPILEITNVVSLCGLKFELPYRQTWRLFWAQLFHQFLNRLCFVVKAQIYKRRISSYNVHNIKRFQGKT